MSKKTKSIGLCDLNTQVVLAESATASCADGPKPIPAGETVKVICHSGDTTFVEWGGITYEIDDANQIKVE